MTREEMVAAALAAYRPLVAAAIKQLDQVPGVTEISISRRDLAAALRPDVEEVTVTRWDLPGGPLWLYASALVSWGGGDAEVYETLVLTEYDLSHPVALAAIGALSDGETVDPARYEREWTATNTQARLRQDAGMIEAMRLRLDAGLRRWVEAVSQLRRLDSGPHPVPVVGGREL